ncbi:MAG: phosphosulfolactate synthase [Proteobacteria bacterium]|nr:phosphosulfolactate synthase [Pseudomonadota bacterium]
MKYPFDMVALPEARSTEKPRKTGLTMIVDFGEPIEQMDALLGVAGNYIDLWKIAVGSARLYEESYLRKKLNVLERHRVRSFIGGQFLEYIFATQGWQGVTPFLAEAKRLGVGAIEVSDNCVPLTDDERERMIRMVAEAGIEVHGEVGSKDTKQAVADLIRQADICIRAGCEIVLVEAAELVIDGAVQAELVEAVRDGIDPEHLLVELPGYWIKGTTKNDVFEMMKFLVSVFGPDANIANVPSDMVMVLEGLRVGLGVVGPTERAEPGAL